METIFIGSYKTIEEHYAVICQELSDLRMSNIFIGLVLGILCYL